MHEINRSCSRSLLSRENTQSCAGSKSWPRSCDIMDGENAHFSLPKGTFLALAS